MKKCIALIILDGWGYREEKKNNAIASADTPFFDSLWNNFPHALLEASGESVGHMTSGAGRIIETDLVRIGQAISSGAYKTNPAFNKLLRYVKDYNSTLHVMGLVSPIGVHSHSEHLYEFLKLGKEEGVEKIAIHVFTDGRDSPPQSAAEFLTSLEKLLSDLGAGHIATVAGRYYAMDRDKNWERTETVLQALFESKGEKHSGKKPSETLEEKYRTGAHDEHLEPIIFPDPSGKIHKIEKNDGVFFFNFRNDRARQLVYKIIEKTQGQNVMLATMTEYAPDIKSEVAFPRLKIEDTLAEAPEMRAQEIADAAIKSIEASTDFLVINFANADMVGHTADFEATKKAAETIDRELKRVVEELEKNDGIAFITADHGNAEINVEHSPGKMHTAHTLSPVPAIITTKGIHLRNGNLADVAPTILALFGIPVPARMTGQKLF